MTLERGLVVAGKVVEGTEWVRRDTEAWFEPGERGTRPRAAVIDKLVFHWTAGRTTRTGPQVVKAMKARLRDGRPLNVGIHFVAQWDGEVWQTADPGLTATCHVGKGYVNEASIGVETTWPGTVSQATKIHDPALGAAIGAGVGAVRDATSTVTIAGHRVEILYPSPALLAACVRLAEALAALDGEAGVAIPRQVPSELGRRFTIAEAKRWAGAMEHHLTPGTTKLDAAGRLLAALAEAGWRVAPP